MTSLLILIGMISIIYHDKKELIYYLLNVFIIWLCVNIFFSILSDIISYNLNYNVINYTN